MSLDTEYYPCTKGRYTEYVLTSSQTRRPLSLIGSVSAPVSVTSVVDDRRKTNGMRERSRNCPREGASRDPPGVSPLAWCNSLSARLSLVPHSSAQRVLDGRPIRGPDAYRSNSA